MCHSISNYKELAPKLLQNGNKYSLVDDLAIGTSSLNASYLGQSCSGICSATNRRPPGATVVCSSGSSSCCRLGGSPTTRGGRTHYLQIISLYEHIVILHYNEK